MFGSMAEWVAAIAAMGALLAAVWAARTSKDLYDLESKRERGLVNRTRREQASGIAAWCVFCPDHDSQTQSGILLHNSSDAPVFNVEILSTYSQKQAHAPQDQEPLNLAILPPGDYVSNKDVKFHWSFPEERSAVASTIRPVMKNSKWVVTEVKFTDSHGTRWNRRGGELTEIPHPSFASA